MVGMELVWNIVEFLLSLTLAVIVTGMIALVLWLAHKAGKRGQPAEIRTHHMEEYLANHRLLMEQKPDCDFETDAECDKHEDGIHCVCWFDDNKCCACGEG